MAKLIESIYAGLNYNGSALSFGKVEFYEAGTNIKKNVYQDRTASIISPNPVTLDINGRAVLFAEGIYKIIFKDKYGKILSSNDNIEFTNASSPSIQDIKRTGNSNIFDNSDFSRWNGGAPEISAHLTFSGKIVTASGISSNVTIEQDTDGSVKLTPSSAPWYFGYRFSNLTQEMADLLQKFIIACKLKALSEEVFIKVFNGSQNTYAYHSGEGSFEQLTPNSFEYIYDVNNAYIDIVVGSDTNTSVVNLSEIWGNVGEVLRPSEPTTIDYLKQDDLTGFADPNGNPANTFKVATATQADEAIRKEQLDNNVSTLQENIDANASNITTNSNEISGKEPSFTKNSAFNKNFGNTTGTVCQGDDSRLSDARTPVSHTHDDRYYTETEINTQMNGKENSIGDKGTAFNKNFGTASNTVCQGNDSRLSDARTPTAHTHDDRYYTESEVNTIVADFIENDGVDFSTYTGYQKLSTGLILQWGTTGVVQNGVQLQQNFPIPFPTKCCSISLTTVSTSSPAGVIESYDRFKFFISTNGENEYLFFAVGY